MSGQQQIAFAEGQHFERKLAATVETARFMAFRKIERMMSHYDLDDLLRQQTQAFTRARDLTLVDAAVLESQRARRVDSQRGDLRVEKKRFEFRAYKSTVPRERTNESHEDVI